MSASLAVVANNPAHEAENPAEAVESLTDRIRRLQEEARVMAREHIAQLEASIAQVARLASEVADGGDAYPVGVREMARQMIADCESRQLGLQAILHRTGNVH
ncbi:MAG TPA: hypothetical protein VD906_16810 [Caulobacteraceae bacterium]|nr:hypothetical protein [Caulobacteraceae bacterium]